MIWVHVTYSMYKFEFTCLVVLHCTSWIQLSQLFSVKKTDHPGWDSNPQHTVF